MFWERWYSVNCFSSSVLRFEYGRDVEDEEVRLLLYFLCLEILRFDFLCLLCLSSFLAPSDLAAATVFAEDVTVSLSVTAKKRGLPRLNNCDTFVALLRTLSADVH